MKSQRKRANFQAGRKLRKLPHVQRYYSSKKERKDGPKKQWKLIESTGELVEKAAEIALDLIEQLDPSKPLKGSSLPLLLETSKRKKCRVFSSSSAFRLILLSRTLFTPAVYIVLNAPLMSEQFRSFSWWFRQRPNARSILMWELEPSSQRSTLFLLLPNGQTESIQSSIVARWLARSSDWPLFPFSPFGVIRQLFREPLH